MSWEQLEDLQRENREEHARWLVEPPLSCPIDGEPLDVHPDGRRNCPYGNYRWSGQRKEH